MQIFIMRIHPACPEPATKHSFTGQPGEPMSSSIAAGADAVWTRWRSCGGLQPIRRVNLGRPGDDLLKRLR